MEILSLPHKSHLFEHRHTLSQLQLKQHNTAATTITSATNINIIISIDDAIHSLGRFGFSLGHAIKVILINKSTLKTRLCLREKIT